MAPDDSFREMPLEVRVSRDAIAEIYGVRDFFGKHETAAPKSVRCEEEIWDEMRAGVVRKQRSRGLAFWPQSWRGTILAAGAGVLVSIMIFWWAK